MTIVKKIFGYGAILDAILDKLDIVMMRYLNNDANIFMKYLD